MVALELLPSPHDQVSAVHLGRAIGAKAGKKAPMPSRLKGASVSLRASLSKRVEVEGKRRRVQPHDDQLAVSSEEPSQTAVMGTAIATITKAPPQDV